MIPVRGVSIAREVWVAVDVRIAVKERPFNVPPEPHSWKSGPSGPRPPHQTSGLQPRSPLFLRHHRLLRLRQLRTL